MNVLIQLSENDKRFIFVVLLLFILIFVIIGYLGMLIVRVMKYQGKKLDHYVAPVVKLKVITDKKKFKKYARKKNWRIFYKQARIPVLILLVGALILVIRNIIVGNFAYNPFHEGIYDAENEVYTNMKSFSSLLWIWKNNIKVTDGALIIKGPTLIHSPEFVVEAIPAYLFVLCLLVGGLWYLYIVQSYIAREIRIRKLSDQVFSTNLDNYNQMDDIASETNQNQTPQNNNPNNNDSNMTL